MNALKIATVGAVLLALGDTSSAARNFSQKHHLAVAVDFVRCELVKNVLVRGCGSLFAFIDHRTSRYRSVASMNERPTNQDQSNKRENHRSTRGEEHPLGPSGHILLGAKVAGLTILFFLGLGIIFLSFNRAGDAFDLAADGFKYGWCIFGGWIVLGLVGAGLSSGVVTYALDQHGKTERRTKDRDQASSSRNVVQPIAERHWTKNAAVNPPRLILLARLRSVSGVP